MKRLQHNKTWHDIKTSFKSPLVFSPHRHVGLSIQQSTFPHPHPQNEYADLSTPTMPAMMMPKKDINTQALQKITSSSIFRMHIHASIPVLTSTSTHAVTPVPHDATTGPSKSRPDTTKAYASVAFQSPLNIFVPVFMHPPRIWYFLRVELSFMCSTLTACHCVCRCSCMHVCIWVYILETMHTRKHVERLYLCM